jgi:glutamate dehydrogenase (NADP+)
VAIFAIEKIQQLGGSVAACSDSGEFVHDPGGIDLDVLKGAKLVERRRACDCAQRRPAAALVTGGNIWDVPCQVAVPAATHNDLTGRDVAGLVRNGCIAVVEGANMPTTPDGVRTAIDAGIAFGPGKAANAGGVAMSALEMQQNATRDSWAFEHGEARLAEIMAAVHDTCVRTAEAYGAPGNYAAGANIAGFLRVTQAMFASGLI